MSIEQEQYFLILNRIEKKLKDIEDRIVHIEHQNKCIFEIVQRLKDININKLVPKDPTLDLRKQEVTNMDLFKMVFDEIVDTRKKYFPIYYAVSREELKSRLLNRYNIEFEETIEMIDHFIKIDSIYEIACMPDHYRKVSNHW